jgi:hypothetical protein
MLVPHGTWLSLQKSAPSEMRASLSCELTAGKTQDETTRSLSVVNRLIRLNNACGHAGHTGKSRLVMANLVPNIEAGCQSVPDLVQDATTEISCACRLIAVIAAVVETRVH